MSSGGSHWGLFARRADVHCVLFHLLTLAAYGLAFWTYAHPERAHIEGPYALAAFVAAAALLLGWLAGIDLGVNFHNHAHRRIFTVGRLNRWFGRLWTVSSGWPAYFWLYTHVVVHHRRLLQGRDWTLPRRRADGSWENYYKYCFLHWPWRYAYNLYREFQSGNCSAAIRRRALVEFGVFAGLWSIPFWIDPWMALWLWVLPQYIGNTLVLAPGMIAQHAGREVPSESHVYRHSNTYVSRFFNLAMFNIGYHAEHHTYPHVHWADLPELHLYLKQDLIRDGAHVLPFGYFRGGLLLAAAARSCTSAQEEFDAQHPDYVGPQTPAPPRSGPRWRRRAHSTSPIQAASERPLDLSEHADGVA